MRNRPELSRAQKAGCCRGSVRSTQRCDATQQSSANETRWPWLILYGLRPHCVTSMHPSNMHLQSCLGRGSWTSFMGQGHTARCRRLKVPPDSASDLLRRMPKRSSILECHRLLPPSDRAHGDASFEGHSRASCCLSVTLTSAPSEMSWSTAAVHNPQNLSCEGGTHALLVRDLADAVTPVKSCLRSLCLDTTQQE